METSKEAECMSKILKGFHCTFWHLNSSNKTSMVTKEVGRTPFHTLHILGFRESGLLWNQKQMTQISLPSVVGQHMPFKATADNGPKFSSMLWWRNRRTSTREKFFMFWPALNPFMFLSFHESNRTGRWAEIVWAVTICFLRHSSKKVAKVTWNEENTIARAFKEACDLSLNSWRHPTVDWRPSAAKDFQYMWLSIFALTASSTDRLASSSVLRS